MKAFSVNETIKFGFEKAKGNFWFLLSIVVAGYLLAILGSKVVLGSLFGVVSNFFLMCVFLRTARGERVEWKNIGDGLTFPLFFHFLLASLIVSVATTIGLLLLVVPGIIIALGTIFTSFIILEKKGKLENTAFWLAIRDSWRMTRGYKWRIFVFLLALLGVNVLGALALGVGLLFTIPLSGIALAHAYEKIKGAKEGNVEASAPS